MSFIDNVIQGLLLSFFVWNNIVRYPIPLTILDKDVVFSTMIDFNRGVCPFVISPDFGKNDAYLDKYRRIAYNYQNSSLLYLKAALYFENEIGRDSINLFENIYQQLTATIPLFILQDVIKRTCVCILITFSSYVLYDSKQLDNCIENLPAEGRLLSYAAYRVIFLFYVVGSTDIHADNTDHFYFFLTVLTTLGCMNATIILTSQLFEKALLEKKITKYSRLKFACIALSTLLIAFFYILICICQSSQIEISDMYSLLLTLDSLTLAARSWYLLMRIFIADSIRANQKTENQCFLFKLLVLYVSDLLEAISTCISIFFGLFIKRRLIVLLLVTHARRLFQRVFLLQLPDKKLKNKFVLLA